MPKINIAKTHLARRVQEMPPEILEELKKSNLLDDYYARPDYQQNDYLTWISRAKMPETRRKRMDQMLHELTEGGVYMGMQHPASRRLF